MLDPIIKFAEDLMGSILAADPLTIVGLILTIEIFIVSNRYFLKEIKENKKKMMFEWVHQNLIGSIYIPLNAWSLSIFNLIYWNGSQRNKYREKIFLYRVSKLLNHMYKNRAIVGDDLFFTASSQNNYRLSCLCNLIIVELNEIFELKYAVDNNGSTVEKRLISIELLAEIGNCKNYTDFLLTFEGKKAIENSILPDQKMSIKQNLVDMGLIYDQEGQVRYYINSIFSLYSDNFESRWILTKLYTYCYLFNYIMSYELYNTYDSWYEDRKTWLERRIIYKLFSKIKLNYLYKSYLNFIEKTENEYLKYKNSLSDIKELPFDTSDFSLPLDLLHDTKRKIQIGILKRLCQKIFKEDIELSYTKFKEFYYQELDKEQYYYIISRIYGKRVSKKTEELFNKLQKIEKKQYYLNLEH